MMSVSRGNWPHVQGLDTADSETWASGSYLCFTPSGRSRFFDYTLWADWVLDRCIDWRLL